MIARRCDSLWLVSPVKLSIEGGKVMPKYRIRKDRDGAWHVWESKWFKTERFHDWVWVAKFDYWLIALSFIGIEEPWK